MPYMVTGKYTGKTQPTTEKHLRKVIASAEHTTPKSDAVATILTAMREGTPYNTNIGSYTWRGDPLAPAEPDRQAPSLFDDLPPAPDQRPDPEPITVSYGDAGDIEEKFREFHSYNPDVYTGLLSLARQAHAQGHPQYSMTTLYSVLRFEYDLAAGVTNSDYKLNNNYQPYYTRLIEHHNPELAGFLEKRTSRADQVDYSTIPVPA